MAKCRLCDKSGWLLRTNPEGLCKACEPLWAMDVDQHSRIISESVKLIENSKNVKTRLSRIDVARRSCEQLLHYEQRSIETIATPPSKAIHELERVRKELVENHIEEELVKARTKSQSALTLAGKTQPFGKVIEKIGEFYSAISDVTVLEQLERETREELDKARLEIELEKAEKAEFKGQKKKAIDAYLGALFIISKDSIDDERQATQIRDIKAKISALGGEVPG